MAPLLPLGFIMVYQVDAAYGTLVCRMRGKTARRRQKYLREIAKLAKNPCLLRLILLPVVPLGEAESIMASERERLELPHGIPTFDSIEKERRSRSSLSSILEK